MDHERLWRSLGDIERLCSIDSLTDIRGVANRLTQIKIIAADMRDSLAAQQGAMSSQSSYADTKLTAESVEAARSGLASTVGIDDQSGRAQAGHMGFIDAIRLAALSVENTSDSPRSHSRETGSLDNGEARHADGGDATQERHPFAGAASRSTSNVQQVSNSSSLTNSISASVSTSNLSDPPPLLENSVLSNTSSAHKVSRRHKYFGKCFPTYRKLFRYETQSKSFLRSKGSSTFYPALSLDTLHAALANHQKFMIYHLSDEYNEKPRLKFEGETGFTKANCFVAMNNMWVVIASADGTILVVSLQNGTVLFRKSLKLEVTALDVSSDGSYIGVAVVKPAESRTKVTRRQPHIYLICPSTMISPESAFEHFDIISFPSPYQDFVRSVSFNEGETAMVCSTEKESRVFIVSLADYREPRILMRSKRSNTEINDEILLDETDKHSQGITGAKFLPNSRYILLCSDAQNAPPVVLDTKLTVSKGKSPKGKIVQYLMPSGHQQSVVMRFDKMGSTIQTCAASNKGNGAAFADCSGSLYAVNLPPISTEPRKIAVVFDLAPGLTVHSAPALRFTPDGTALIAVDRKGDIHIADFGAGHPQQPGIMKTKVLS